MGTTSGSFVLRSDARRVFGKELTHVLMSLDMDIPKLLQVGSLWWSLHWWPTKWSARDAATSSLQPCYLTDPRIISRLPWRTETSWRWNRSWMDTWKAIEMLSQTTPCQLTQFVTTEEIFQPCVTRLLFTKQTLVQDYSPAIEANSSNSGSSSTYGSRRYHRRPRRLNKTKQLKVVGQNTLTFFAPIMLK